MSFHNAADGRARASALLAVVERLRCPLCAAPLACRDGALVCHRRHTYDIARAGHVSLPAPGRRPPRGDSHAMVAARAAFLGAGHFDPISRAIAELALAARGPRAQEPGCVVDVGAGTGHHLARVIQALPAASGLALDASPAAVRRAARMHPRVAAVVCDAWRPLPLRDGAADLLLNAFAPRDAPELRRVLAPGGGLLLVWPTARHLAQLVPALGLLRVAPDKAARVAAQMRPLFRRERTVAVEYELALGHDDVRALVRMGPSAHHVGDEELERRLAVLPPTVFATVSVLVELARPTRARARPVPCH